MIMRYCFKCINVVTNNVYVYCIYYVLPNDYMHCFELKGSHFIPFESYKV